jgi:BolA protein
MNAVSASDVEAALRASLTPSRLEVIDDSDKHAGHAGAREGRHFTVRVTSTRFNGLTRLARHRLVYSALHGLIAQGIHAIAIDARSPDEP